VSPPLELSPARALGLQQSRVCGGLSICGRTVCEGKPCGEAGGAGRAPVPLCISATLQLPKPGVGARKLEPDRAGSRHRCSLLQPIAVACKAGAVSTRYFLRLDRSSNLRVGGCRRRYASQRPSQPKAARESLPARHRVQLVSDFFKFGFISRGRIGPFGFAKSSKRQVRFFISQCVRVDAKYQHRVGVTQRICNQADDLTGVKGDGFPRVPCTVEL
jgi:hypothetical protein